jgi:TPR repeat protein
LLRRFRASLYVRGAAHYFKLAADQGLREKQFYYGLVLRKGSSIPVDLRSTGHSFKLAADQSLAEAQYNYGMALSKSFGVSGDIQVNEGSRLLRMQVIAHFVRLFGGFLRYACLLQLAIEMLSPGFPDDFSVFRDFFLKEA